MESTAPVQESSPVDQVDLRCEMKVGGTGPLCGRTAHWAIVFCCHTKFVCDDCLSTVMRKWKTVERICKLCETRYFPAMDAIQRIVEL